MRTRLDSALAQDHQLVRQLDAQLFKRLRGRLPELSSYLLEVKARHVEHVTHEEVKVIKEVVMGVEEDVEKAMEELKVEEGWKEGVKREMKGYAEEVREEAGKIKEYIKDTLKYLEKTLQRFLPEEEAK